MWMTVSIEDEQVVNFMCEKEENLGFDMLKG